MKQTFLLLSLYLFLSSAAQERMKLPVNGLKAEVEVIRDRWGVNHIYAANEHDLFFAQGYCAARDRLFQFEIWRRQATGTVAEILGSRELKRDIGTRLFLFRGNMKKELSHYHPHGQAIIQVYVDGVNAYIRETEKNPSLLPVEFRLLNIRPKPWTAEVVISRHQGLLGNITDELNIGRAVAGIGATKVKELQWFHPRNPLINLDSSIKGDLLLQDILGLYNAFRKQVEFRPEDIRGEAKKDQALAAGWLNRQMQTREEKVLEGSNNWVISGKKTASGAPIMANDPHRRIAIPSLRYMVHLVAPGWNVTGGGEPEIPGVSIGHNEYGAWGLTVFETDGEDLYVYDINPKNPDEYLYKGKWEKMKIIRDTIAVKNQVPVPVLLLYTRHGPVCFVDTLHHKAYAVRCAWLEPGGSPYLASLRMDQARNWVEFRDACTYSHIPGENMVWADKKGNIGWQAVGIAPIRKNFSGLVPVPGDGRYEWAGYLPIKEKPHRFNPPEGFIATANENVTSENYTHWDAIGYNWSDPFRSMRIHEVLQKENRITLPMMEALQTDYYSIPARQLVPLLHGMVWEEKHISIARDSLLKWNFILDKESAAAGIYAAWEKKIMSEAYREFVPPEARPWIDLQLTKVLRWIMTPGKEFGEHPLEKRNHFLNRTFALTVEELQKKLGEDIRQWQYGQSKYKHVYLEHPLAGLLDSGWQEKLNAGPAPRGGNGNTPGSTGSGDNQVSGASFRIVTDLSDWDKARAINTPGQSGDPESRYYKNLFDTWAKDGYFPLYYSREKIEKATDEHLQLVPEK